MRSLMRICQPIGGLAMAIRAHSVSVWRPADQILQRLTDVSTRPALAFCCQFCHDGLGDIEVGKDVLDIVVVFQSIHQF